MPTAPVIVALDFETANNSRNSACQLGLVRLEGWQVAAEKAWLIRPPSPLFIHSGIHGICWEDVAESPDFGELWPEVSAYLAGAAYLAAHNAPFDRGVMGHTLAHYSLAAPELPYLDTVRVARQVWEIYPTKLNLVCDRLSIPLNHHQALSDARACAQILVKARQQGWKPG
jgi:DNA polymerase-3 subunit epsilon